VIAHSIPQLDIEQLDNGCLRLENTHCGETYAVDVHPSQLRLMAEMAGLLGDVSASDAELLRTERGRVAELSRDLDRTQCNMLRVRERALSLQHGFANDADWQHADLTHEMGLINALVDLLDMACSDFEHSFDKSDPAPFEPAGMVKVNPAETQRVIKADGCLDEAKAGDCSPAKRTHKVVTVTTPAGTAQPALI
jgi:hypothetical protein